jgi:hypothetical protein
MSPNGDFGVSLPSLKGRILGALPAASYQMDRFLSLIDVVVSDLAPTACVDSGPQPKMHVNPSFIKKYCRYDEQLLMLVLHELYHVILGHTRLFPRTTEAHNIAFDAYINALLCRQFRDNPFCVDFFRSVNGATQFPGRLLRPPFGWPRRIKLERDCSPSEVRVMNRLYGEKAGSVTYKEILDVLRPQHGTDLAAGVILLGDHSGEERAGEKDSRAMKDEILTGLLRDVVKDWPKDATAGLEKPGGKKRCDGGDIVDFLMPRPRNPRKEFLVALARLLALSGALRPMSPYDLHWKRVRDLQDITSVFPDLRDRQAHGKEALWGECPILFTTSKERSTRRLIPRHAVHVYLDISGSMAAELPWLAAALDPLERTGAIEVYVFSTVVSKVPHGGLLWNSIQNTYGTNINCVLQHLIDLPKRFLPGRTVILTDGYVGAPEKAHVNIVKKRNTQLYFGLVGPHHVFDWMRECAKTILELPPCS